MGRLRFGAEFGSVARPVRIARSSIPNFSGSKGPPILASGDRALAAGRGDSRAMFPGTGRCCVPLSASRCGARFMQALFDGTERKKAPKNGLFAIFGYLRNTEMRLVAEEASARQPGSARLRKTGYGLTNV